MHWIVPSEKGTPGLKANYVLTWNPLYPIKQWGS